MTALVPFTSNTSHPAAPARRRPSRLDERPAPGPSDPQRVAVLMGGANTERYVSLSSGLAVGHALRTLGYAVAELDSAMPVRDPDVPAAARFTTATIATVSDRPVAPTAEAPPGADEIARLRAGQQGGVLAPGILPVLENADVVFLTVFGDEGESGAIQAYLDAKGLVYTGPTAAVCALTFDKAATKSRVAVGGVRGPAGHVVRRRHVRADLGALTIGPPWIVKPVAGGSTIGLSAVTERASLPAAVQRACASGGDALIEALIPGRDFTVGVLGDRVFAVVETISHRPLYDYAAKYRPGASSKRVPAQLTAAQTDEVRALARRAHDLLGVGATSSRSDFRLDPHGRLWFFELNPLPGLTPTSSYPISAAAEGIDFPQLCHQLVQRAVARPGRATRAASPARS